MGILAFCLAVLGATRSVAQERPPCGIDFTFLLDVSGSMYLDVEPFRSYNRIPSGGSTVSLIDYMVRTVDGIGTIEPPVLSPAASVSFYTFYSTVRPQLFAWESGRGHLFELLDLNRDGKLDGRDFPAHSGQTKTDLAAVLARINSDIEASPDTRAKVFLVFTDGVHDAASDLSVPLAQLKAKLAAGHKAPLVAFFFGFGGFTQAGQIAGEVGGSYLDMSRPELVQQLGQALSGILSSQPRLADLSAGWDPEAEALQLSFSIANPGCAVNRVQRIHFHGSGQANGIDHDFDLAGQPLELAPFGRGSYRLKWKPGARRLPAQLEGDVGVVLSGGTTSARVGLPVSYSPAAVIHRVGFEAVSPTKVGPSRQKDRSLLFPIRMTVEAVVKKACTTRLPVTLWQRNAQTGGIQKRSGLVDIRLAATGPVTMTLGPEWARREGMEDPAPASPYEVIARVGRPEDPAVVLAGEIAEKAVTVKNLGTPDEISLKLAKQVHFSSILGGRGLRITGEISSRLWDSERRVDLVVKDGAREIRRIRAIVKPEAPFPLNHYAWTGPLHRELKDPKVVLETPGTLPGEVLLVGHRQEKESAGGREQRRAVPVWVYEILVAGVLSGIGALVVLSWRRTRSLREAA